MGYDFGGVAVGGKARGRVVARVGSVRSRAKICIPAAFRLRLSMGLPSRQTCVCTPM